VPLRGHNDTPFGRPTPGHPIGRPGVSHPSGVFGVFSYYLLVMIFFNIVPLIMDFTRCATWSRRCKTFKCAAWSLRWRVQRSSATVNKSLRISMETNLCPRESRLQEQARISCGVEGDPWFPIFDKASLSPTHLAALKALPSTPYPWPPQWATRRTNFIF
jgi:hypothetical protein